MAADGIHLGDVGAALGSAVLTACLSAKGMPSAGSASSAEPPPEIRQSTRSSGPADRAISSMRAAAACPASSGTGCAASTISIRSQARRAVAGDDEAGQRPCPVILDRLRHGGRGLAGAEDDGASLGGAGVAGDDAGRKGCRNRGIEHAAQQLRGLQTSSRRSPLRADVSPRSPADSMTGCHLVISAARWASITTRRRLSIRTGVVPSSAKRSITLGSCSAVCAPRASRGSPAACRPARTGHARPSSRSPRGRIPAASAGREARRSARRGHRVALDRVRADLRDRVGGLVAHGVEHATEGRSLPARSPCRRGGHLRVEGVREEHAAEVRGRADAGVPVKDRVAVGLHVVDVAGDVGGLEVGRATMVIGTSVMRPMPSKSASGSKASLR